MKWDNEPGSNNAAWVDSEVKAAWIDSVVKADDCPEHSEQSIIHCTLIVSFYFL